MVRNEKSLEELPETGFIKSQKRENLDRTYSLIIEKEVAFNNAFYFSLWSLMMMVVVLDV